MPLAAQLSPQLSARRLWQSLPEARWRSPSQARLLPEKQSPPRLLPATAIQVQRLVDLAVRLTWRLPAPPTARAARTAPHSAVAASAYPVAVARVLTKAPPAVVAARLARRLAAPAARP